MRSFFQITSSIAVGLDMEKNIILHKIIIFCITAILLESTEGKILSCPLASSRHKGEEVVANNDFISMHENSSWIISVTNNDYGLQSGIQNISIVTNPAHGIVEVLSNQNIRYTPNERYIGNDLFEYRICNNDGNCDEASVAVIVDDYDYIPAAVNDTLIYYNDSSAVFDVLANDNNLYDIPLRLSIIKNMSNGYSEVTDDLKIKITVTNYFNDTDSLTYQVCDKEGDCGQAVMFINYNHNNETSVFIPEAFSPNGDGYNDTFRVPAFKNYQSLSLLVFNRNGIKVFNTSSFNNNWDGIANTGPMKGKLVPKGIYFFIITVGDTSEEFKGSLFISH
jgi:gliding motility-associated-like protein